jgi:hypothetical protein
MTTDTPTIYKLRCDIATTDAAVAGMTSDVLLDRLNLTWQDIDPYGSALNAFTAAVDEASDPKVQDDAKAKLEAERMRLIGLQKSKWCTAPDPKSLSIADQADIAATALSLCSGGSGHAAPDSSANDTGFQEAYTTALQKSVSEKQTAKAAALKVCADKCASEFAACQKANEYDDSECYPKRTSCQADCMK